MSSYESRLVSVIILTFNNLKYIYDTIDSILLQNYPLIEIIVSDDCSDEFNEHTLLNYIIKNRHNNIKQIVINKYRCNLGTVAHLNYVLSKVNGNFVKFLSPGDKFFEPNSLSSLMNSFSGNVKIVHSKCIINDNFYNRNTIPSEKELIYFSELDSECLLKELMVENKLSIISSIFKKEVFQVIGYFDENYFLLEDWPMWIKICEQKIPIYFLNRVTISYKTGGISTVKNNIELNELLDDDILRLYELKIKNSLKVLSFYKRKKAKFLYNKIKAIRSGNKIKIFLFLITNIDLITQRKIKRWRIIRIGTKVI